MVFVVDLIQSVVVVEPIFCNQRPPGSVIISGGMCVQCRGMLSILTRRLINSAVHKSY